MTNKTQHFRWKQLGRLLKTSSWGKSFSSENAAAEWIASEPERVTAAAVAYIASMFSAGDSREIHDTTDSKPDKNSCVMPDVRPGDMFWSGCIEDEGFGQIVVLEVDDVGHLRTCALGCCYLTWQYTLPHRTLKDALRAAAERDIKYHEPRLLAARQAVEDCDNGADLSKYVDGVNFDD